MSIDNGVWRGNNDEYPTEQEMKGNAYIVRARRSKDETVCSISYLAKLIIEKFKQDKIWLNRAGCSKYLKETRGIPCKDWEVYKACSLVKSIFLKNESVAET